MKKIISIIVTGAAILFGTSVFAAEMTASPSEGIFKTNVVIPYENIHLDSSLSSFKKASKANQLEILNEFCRKANEEFKACKTVSDIRALRTKLDLIDDYNLYAKVKSMAVTNQLLELRRKVTALEEKAKGINVIEGMDYRHNF